MCVMGHTKDEPPDSGWCSGLLKNTKEVEDEKSAMLPQYPLPLLARWRVGLPARRVSPGHRVSHRPAEPRDSFQDFVVLLFAQKLPPREFTERSLLLSGDKKG